MFSTWWLTISSALTRKDVVTQIKCLWKHVVVQFTGYRECQTLVLAWGSSRDSSCVNLVFSCLLTELRESVERLGGVTDSKNEMVWWNWQDQTPEKSWDVSVLHPHPARLKGVDQECCRQWHWKKRQVLSVNIWLCEGGGDIALGKLCNDRPRLEGQSAGEGALLMILRCASHTGPHFKSYKDEKGVVRQQKPTGKYQGNISKEIRDVPLRRQYMSAQLWCLYTKTCRTGNKQEDLGNLWPENYDLLDWILVGQVSCLQ